MDSPFEGERKYISANESSVGFEEMEDTITKVASAARVPSSIKDKKT